LCTPRITAQKPWLPLLRKPQVYSAVYDLCDLRDNQGLIDIARAEKLANVISADLEAANSKNRLESDPRGVVKFWGGSLVQQTCPHCHQKMGGHWELSQESRTEAH
jgi:hypothetical protein